MIWREKENTDSPLRLEAEKKEEGMSLAPKEQEKDIIPAGEWKGEEKDLDEDAFDSSS